MKTDRIFSPLHLHNHTYYSPSSLPNSQKNKKQKLHFNNTIQVLGFYKFKFKAIKMRSYPWFEESTCSRYK
jgi:hypothetical protein